MKTKRQKKLEEIDRAKSKLKELEDDFQDIVAKQESERDCIKMEIDSLIEGKPLFCGIILTEENLIDLFKLKLANPKENIKIAYKLYIEEHFEADNGTI